MTMTASRNAPRFRFHDWEVYRAARQFRIRILREVAAVLPKEERFELGSQLRRALSSILLNLAEGAYRMSDRDFVVFLNRAGASAYEVAAILDCCCDDGVITSDVCDALQGDLAGIIQQIGSFQKYVTRQATKRVAS